MNRNFGSVLICLILPLLLLFSFYPGSLRHNIAECGQRLSTWDPARVSDYVPIVQDSPTHHHKQIATRLELTVSTEPVLIAGIRYLYGNDLLKVPNRPLPLFASRPAPHVAETAPRFSVKLVTVAGNICR